MFYAFSRFNRPRDFIAARSSLLNWAEEASPAVYFQHEPAEFIARTLTQPDLLKLEDLSDAAWQRTGFGGYLTGEDKAEIRGFTHFELDELQVIARLTALLEESTAAGGNFPALQAGLTDLLREVPYLEKIYLPVFAAGAEWLAGLHLVPGAGPEEWRVDYDDKDAAPGNDTLAVTEVDAARQDWLELSVRAEPEAVEAITELLARYGYNQGVVIEEAMQPGPDGGVSRDPGAPVVLRTYVPVGKNALAGVDKVREGLFYLGKLRHIEELQVNSRREEDWANAWKEFYQVHRVGRRTLIKPPWQEYAPLPDDIVVEIDPGMAFGTGLHPTTRLCLQLLEDHVDPAVHHKALDLGTGSGILAIAAAKLGLPYILGVDTDEVAVRAARENVARNGLSERVKMETGSLAVEVNAPVDGGFYAFSDDAQQPPPELLAALPFDLVIANIIARVLSALAPAMASALRPRGLLITSGIIGERAAEVDSALQAAGLTLVEKREESDWVAFVHCRAE